MYCSMDIHALIEIASDLRTCGEDHSGDHCSRCNYQDIRIGCSDQMKVDAASTIELLADKLIRAEESLKSLRGISTDALPMWPEVIREPLTQFHVSQEQNVFSSRFHTLAPGDAVWCIERDGDFGPMIISRYLFVAGNTRCVVTSILPESYNGCITDYLIDATKTGVVDNCGYFDESDMGMTVKAFPLRDTFISQEDAMKEKARREFEAAEAEKERKRMARMLAREERLAAENVTVCEQGESVAAKKIPGPPKKKIRAAKQSVAHEDVDNREAK